MKMMETVTQAGGSGTKAAIEGFRVAGKTGTAQKFDLSKGSYSKDAFIASFAGFAPSRNPAITAVVIVDEPQDNIYGGVVAAPIWAEIVSKTLKYLNVQIDDQQNDPGTVPQPDTRWARETSRESLQDLTVMPDLRGLTLREALTRLGKTGARVSVSGSGIVVKQDPGAGKALGAVVSLKLVPRTAG
jgi:cell division protein FtsI (penicillin-binding protein 3)